MGWVEYRSVGAGGATVPGAHHDTVTSVAGSLPQVSSNCSGSVVVGSGRVVVGGPLGAVGARARGARAGVAADAATVRGARGVVPPIAATALTPTPPMMNRRRVNPVFPVVST